MTSAHTSESDVLDTILPKYTAEGFDVYVNPSPSVLPDFMRSFRPDAVAIKKDKKIAIEVVRPNEQTKGRVSQLEQLFATHKDWELLVFYVSPISGPSIEAVPTSVIEERLNEIEELKNSGHYLPALIMSWATFEALGRALLPAQFRRPQTPARLLEVLASEGTITPKEADKLRSAIGVRNLAVHGAKVPNVGVNQVDDFISILKNLKSILT